MSIKSICPCCLVDDKRVKSLEMIAVSAKSYKKINPSRIGKTQLDLALKSYEVKYGEIDSHEESS